MTASPSWVSLTVCKQIYNAYEIRVVDETWQHLMSSILVNLFCNCFCEILLLLPLLQRFGVALVATGQLQLKNKRYASDFEPIDRSCSCSTCRLYTRAYLHTIVTHESVACSLLTIHNVSYQVHLSSWESEFSSFFVTYQSVLNVNQRLAYKCIFIG